MGLIKKTTATSHPAPHAQLQSNSWQLYLEKCLLVTYKGAMGQIKGLQKSDHPIVPPTATSHPRTSCLVHLTSCLKPWQLYLEIQIWILFTHSKLTSGLGNQNTITSHPCTSYLLSSSIPYGYKQSGNSAQLKTKSLLVTHNGAKKKLCKSQTNQSSARHQHGSVHPRTSCTASVYLFAALSGNSMCISQINLMLKAKPLFYFVT